MQTRIGILIILLTLYFLLTIGCIGAEDKSNNKKENLLFLRVFFTYVVLVTLSAFIIYEPNRLILTDPNYYIVSFISFFTSVILLYMVSNNELVKEHDSRKYAYSYLIFALSFAALPTLTKVFHYTI